MIGFKDKNKRFIMRSTLEYYIPKEYIEKDSLIINCIYK